MFSILSTTNVVVLVHNHFASRSGSFVAPTYTMWRTRELPNIITLINTSRYVSHNIIMDIYVDIRRRDFAVLQCGRTESKFLKCSEPARLYEWIHQSELWRELIIISRRVTFPALVIWTQCILKAYGKSLDIAVITWELQLRSKLLTDKRIKLTIDF